jgi:hypothetical protein
MLSRVSASQTHALVIPPTGFASDREVFTAKWLAERGRQFILRFSETGIEALADMLNIPPNRDQMLPPGVRPSIARACSASCTPAPTHPLRTMIPKRTGKAIVRLRIYDPSSDEGTIL